MIAHEYAHNVQHELGLARVDPRYGVEALELQADCMAGLWGNSVYRAGKLQAGDVEEAISTVLAAGDFDTANPQHHGTPDERRAAWLLGLPLGRPGALRRRRRRVGRLGRLAVQQPAAQALARLAEADRLVGDEPDEQRRRGPPSAASAGTSTASGISSGSTTATTSRWRLSVWMLRQRKATWASR